MGYSLFNDDGPALDSYDLLGDTYMIKEFRQSALPSLHLCEGEVRGKVESARRRDRPEHQAEGEDLGPATLEQSHLIV